MKVAILLAAAGIASAAVVARDDFSAAGDALSDYLDTTEPQHHDTALNARDDLNMAELTAREALDSLVESVSLFQRSPDAYLSGLVDNKAKREAAPWCDRNKGAGCWKAKREAEPWCDRNRGAGCWKAKRDASPGPWCDRNRGAGCWKSKRDAEASAEPWCDRNRGAGCWKAKREAEPWCDRNRGAGCWKKRDVDSAEAVLEQRACLAEGGLCSHARRAAESVLDSLKSVEARDSQLGVAARSVLESLQLNSE
jgi:hypothetical protein